MLKLQSELSEGSDKDKPVAPFIVAYNQSLFQLVQAIHGIAGRGGKDVATTLKELTVAEEKMFSSLNSVLTSLDTAYPLEAKAIANEGDFNQIVDQISLGLKANDLQLQSAIANRVGRLYFILAKGAGAVAAEQTQLLELVRQIQEVSKKVSSEFQKIRTNTAKLVEAETANSSKYVPALQAFAVLIDAHIAQAQFIEKLGTPEYKPEDEEKVTTALQAAEANFKQARDALNAAPTGHLPGNLLQISLPLMPRLQRPNNRASREQPARLKVLENPSRDSVIRWSKRKKSDE